MNTGAGSVLTDESVPTVVPTGWFSATWAFDRARSVGASLTLVTVSVKFTEASGVAPTVASSTLTVTLYEDFVSKSSGTPALSRSSVPTISKNAASAPVSESVFVPSASSVMTMSANLIARIVSVFSGSVVVVF